MILSKLAKNDIERLPSVGFKARIMQEALFLKRTQVSEAILGDVSGDSGNYLHGYGTSKYHRHFSKFPSYNNKWQAIILWTFVNR